MGLMLAGYSMALAAGVCDGSMGDSAVHNPMPYQERTRDRLDLLWALAWHGGSDLRHTPELFGVWSRAGVSSLAGARLALRAGVLSALIVPMALAPQGAVDLPWHECATCQEPLVSIVVALVSRSTLVAIVSGFVCFGMWRYFLALKTHCQNSVLHWQPMHSATFLL